ncbi:CLUMA_CG017198, isoform A [Clunio marinus]|uniref:CLUMA_CG017198, isoform A n=1 Tax=Clunio marinus TaxID=568069 RepID=A0A1J1IV48_9DIPT|nr:CLUMA_CG017198, isoform A [Clunio marinus]
MMLNEFSQRKDVIYNYKDCLDHDNSIANNYCKLFSKNEVVIKRIATMSSSGMWKSTENLLPENKKNFTNLWTIYLMITKLHGAIVFHSFLMIYSIQTSTSYVDDVLGMGIIVWMIALGSLIGCILLRFINSKDVYTLASTFGILAIGISYIFVSNDNYVISICLWIYFFAISTAVAIPDIALLEISKIRYNEGALALGFFFEIIAIAVLQTTIEKSVLLNPDSEEYLLHIIGIIVVLVVTSLLFQLHMPNTYNKSLLQIQNELLKFHKYFAIYFDNSLPRSSSENNEYLENNTVNVFEDNARKITEAQDVYPSNDYSEVMENKLPDPPVNKVINFDYNTDIPKPPLIIPRVNYFKEKMSLYQNE